MGAVSQASSPVADLKPTVTDSPLDFLINKSSSNIGSNRMSESIYGDSLTHSTLERNTSMYGDSASNSNINRSVNINSKGNATVTDGGAIMAMFEITKTALEKNSLSNIMQEKQAAAVSAATGAAAGSGEFLDKLKEFAEKHKTGLIVAGLVVGYLVYKGVSK